MSNLQIFVFCCFSVVCVDVLAVLEVTGHVGEDISIKCSGNWTTENTSEHFNLYFCKANCSREKTVIQSPRATAASVQMGRYSLQAVRADGAFKVNIMKLKTADTGRYYCGVGKAVIVLYQEVSLRVQNDASTVPLGSAALPATTLQAKANADRGLSLSTSPPVVQPTTGGKTNLHAAPKLTETMVVIIVSVSLALVVCAIIPLIFCFRWKSSSEAQNKHSTSHAEGSHAAVELQALNVSESSPGGTVDQPLEA